jgi:thioredoxin reductase
MTDITLVAKVSRTALALGDLDINDHVNYVVGGPAGFLGAVQWERSNFGAPWVTGEITVEEHQVNTTESLQVYVAGSSLSSLDTNLGVLLVAFRQHRFTFQMVVDGVNHAWDCGAADVQQVLYDNAHVKARYVTVTFGIPRKPIPLAGVF